MLFHVICRTGVLTAIALISACSGDQAQKRHEANQYLRTTNTIIPADNEIISFPALPEIHADGRQFNADRNAYFGDLTYIQPYPLMPLVLAPPPHRRTPIATHKARQSCTPADLKYNWHSRWISMR